MSRLVRTLHSLCAALENDPVNIQILCEQDPLRVARMIFMATKPPQAPIAPPLTRPARDDGGSVVLERRTQKTQPPQMYQVVMLNDDYTPMEFVIVVLQEFFSKDREQATQIMLKVHMEGRGVCGVYARDVAATKVEQVATFARDNQHPLACVMEEN